MPCNRSINLSQTQTSSDSNLVSCQLGVIIVIYNIVNSFYCNSMDATETISTQVTLPLQLYQAIEQRAQVQGKSVNSEIVALLASLLENPASLVKEFADWEAASDEDWLNLEVALASQEN
jgi:hypothetical protein